MLQQTTVAAVRNYYAAFITRWPKVTDMAAAPLEEVLSQWAGLGYYARARNLHACAIVVTEQYGGVFPDTEAGLRALPGIGEYTAAAMMAIIHHAPTNVVDGNVERVMARLHAVEVPLPKAKPILRSLAAYYVAPARAADWPQALMDLGATLCRPKNSDCNICPVQAHCAAHKTGQPTDYPRRSPKAKRPTRHGVAFIVRRHETVLLRRRPVQGLLGGMSEVPGSDWCEKKDGAELSMDTAPCKADWVKRGQVHHVLTHFTLYLDVYEAQAPGGFSPNDGWWANLDALHDEALPSLMRKVLALGL